MRHIYKCGESLSPSLLDESSPCIVNTCYITSSWYCFLQIPRVGWAAGVLFSELHLRGRVDSIPSSSASLWLLPGGLPVPHPETLHVLWHLCLAAASLSLLFTVHRCTKVSQGHGIQCGTRTYHWHILAWWEESDDHDEDMKIGHSPPPEMMVYVYHQFQ